MNEVDQLLFLCTGNYYRSRYAEELFNHLAKKEELSWRAFSRGAAERGSPDNVGSMSPYALDALTAKGVVPQTRDPQPCTPADFCDAQLVIGLKEAEHRPLLERRFPEFAERVSYWHIDDVEFVQPSIALAMIDDQVHHLISKLK
ncbi:low molecular weight phosphatase family protein [Bradyrhizobium sp. JYMT SZCCT0428]|uniref:arsenate-mycothiol transferase ArsC n=1 Tax=Bradyrhizobium sp. JYMT SZCCT0428 TaxID=2807673 RepID=UPI001BA83660|nr:low molecular weight phosphatase family protein [Bradyrhizobium sp. JYMT SZCCT0428]MBR1157035.1 low molecular weight phosphatase family protein [Bradyrhizobium sp. JYMT SZCCT0428]